VRKTALLSIDPGEVGQVGATTHLFLHLSSETKLLALPPHPRNENDSQEPVEDEW
jgi:hypothetical protein